MISAKGLITPIVNEEIFITASSADEKVVSNEIRITISGQQPTLDELNYIKNGNFDKVNADGSPMMWQGFESKTAVVADGVLKFGASSVKSNIWDYKMAQIINVPYDLKDKDYVLTFKAWADKDRSLQLYIQDSNNGWMAYGTSTDAVSDGTTYWPKDRMKITTQPTVYQLHMNFENMARNASQNFNWQVGESTVKIYLDSVYLVNAEDLYLIKPTAVAILEQAADFKIFPNPVQAEITISKISAANSRVSVYSTVGQKLMEKTANGNQAKFDVSNLRTGMYFLRFSDGSSQKFIKN